SFKSALARCEGVSPVPVTRTLDDVAVLQYTGGTTGVAKGAMLTHGNLVANMLQVHAGLQRLGREGNRLLEEGGEVVIAPLPLDHIHAFTVHRTCMMLARQHNVPITDPRDIPSFVKELKTWKFSSIVRLNPLFVPLMDHPAFKDL